MRSYSEEGPQIKDPPTELRSNVLLVGSKAGYSLYRMAKFFSSLCFTSISSLKSKNIINWRPHIKIHGLPEWRIQKMRERRGWKREQLRSSRRDSCSWGTGDSRGSSNIWGRPGKCFHYFIIFVIRKLSSRQPVSTIIIPFPFKYFYKV